MLTSPQVGDSADTGTVSHNNPPLLELRGVAKRFGAVEALTDVSLEVRAGEILALVGDNGAGKSTLAKVIAGAYQPDAGTIWFEGREVRISSPSHATELGIETVYQDLALADNLDVVGNMFLGRETVRVRLPPFRQLAENEMEVRTLEALKRLNVTTINSVRTRVEALSGGQRQAIAIARASMWDSKLVLLDEPTSALGVSQTQQVLRVIKTLRTQGMSAVLISHNLDEILQISDRIIVLRLGRRVATFLRNQATPEAIVAAITGGSRPEHGK